MVVDPRRLLTEVDVDGGGCDGGDEGGKRCTTVSPGSKTKMQLSPRLKDPTVFLTANMADGGNGCGARGYNGGGSVGKLKSSGFNGGDGSGVGSRCSGGGIAGNLRVNESAAAVVEPFLFAEVPISSGFRGDSLGAGMLFGTSIFGGVPGTTKNISAMANGSVKTSMTAESTCETDSGSSSSSDPDKIFGPLP